MFIERLNAENVCLELGLMPSYRNDNFATASNCVIDLNICLAVSYMHCILFEDTLHLKRLDLIN